MSSSISIDIHFATGANGHNRIRKGKKPKHAKPTRLPRITRLMALAIKYEHLFAKGIVKNQTELADLLGVDESQISMILRLRLLAPDIQELLLNFPEQEENSDPIFITDLRKLSRLDSWDDQRRALQKVNNHGDGASAPSPKTEMINNENKCIRNQGMGKTQR